MAAGWTNSEMHALIGVWSEAEIQSQLDGVSRNRAIYEGISTKLRDLGYQKMWTQCRSKIKI